MHAPLQMPSPSLMFLSCVNRSLQSITHRARITLVPAKHYSRQRQGVTVSLGKRLPSCLYQLLISTEPMEQFAGAPGGNWCTTEGRGLGAAGSVRRCCLLFRPRGILERMRMDAVVLAGKYVRLEPLTHRHVDGLAAASAGETELYRWSPIPQGKAEAAAYVETALAWRDEGSAVPFATVRVADGMVLGSTRFFNFDRWVWPQGHALHGRITPDGCEIGYTWLARSAIRTGANTEAKLLMLTYAFETWKVFRVCFHTDVRNERSRAALERIGGKFEGVLRSHRMAADFIPRDSARYSIVASEWADVKAQLMARVAAV